MSVGGKHGQEDARARLGWKAGFGTVAAMKAIGTSAPLVAPLTRATLVADGGLVEVGSWVNARLEAEIAVRIGEGGGIEALAPAIELVDIDGPAEDPDVILAGGIFHRAVVLGTFARASLEDLTIDVADHVGADPYALTGRPEEVLRAMSRSLAERGEALQPGDVVICGATVPPMEVAPGNAVRVRVNGLGDVSVRLT